VVSASSSRRWSTTRSKNPEPGEADAARRFRGDRLDRA
jgi:hypothetical protein